MVRALNMQSIVNVLLLLMVYGPLLQYRKCMRGVKEEVS